MFYLGCGNRQCAPIYLIARQKVSSHPSSLYMERLLTMSVCTLSVMSALWLMVPITAEARYREEVAGWLPYWSSEEGVEAVMEHLDEIDILYLFVYEVDAGGELQLKAELDEGVWEDLIDEARDEDVALLPTVAWFNGAAMHKVLSDEDRREELVEAIENMVDDGRFDGVNIDFEQKYAETIDYFSQFLKELEDELGRDDLSCALEARTPPDSLWRDEDRPAVIEYANDYEAINRYCDWVELMTYDQMRADLKLNNERRGVPYNPVADIDWVEKVLTLALKDIDADKIMLGIPTYGRAYDVTVAPDWYRDYTPVASVDHDRILELVDEYDLTIGRTAGGEGVITYFPESSPYKIFNQLPTPAGTPTGYEAAAKALLVANVAQLEIPVRLLTFGDAAAAESKLELIEDYDLKGAAFFKFDEHLDPAIWRLF